MSNPRIGNSAGRSDIKRRRVSPALIGAAVAGVLALIAVIIALLPRQSPPVAEPPSKSVRPAAPQVGTRPSDGSMPEASGKEFAEIDDDGKTLWSSPTDGKPLELAYLPPGVQVIVDVRVAAILKNSEGEKVVAALGPLGQQGIQWIEVTLQVPVKSIERLVVGCQAMSDGGWQNSVVIHAEPSVVSEAIAKLSDAAEMKHGSETYRVANGHAYYVPASEDGGVLVVTAEGAIADIIKLAGERPPLRRDIERLISYTDADRQFTMIVAPNALFSEGQSMFAGTMSGLRLPLFWFLGDELSAAALSLNWEENFFIELIATPTLDNSPERAARLLNERLAEVPDKLEEYVTSLNPSSYGRLVVARLPGMVRKLAAYTRNGFDKDHAVLRCYLPAVAGHNLIMAAELTLAEQSGAGDTVADIGRPEAGDATTSPAVTIADNSSSVEERLKKKTSLSFARDTLEAALEQLASDIGVAIEIRGPDLQAEGITKNQSFGIDLEDRPAEEILVEILRLANPDKTAMSAKDEKQKLVYVIVPVNEGGGKKAVVTTRMAAASRGEQLPAAFRPN